MVYCLVQFFFLMSYLSIPLIILNTWSTKQFSFSRRVINNWNELPDSVVLADNLNMFKRNLDFFWKDKDLKYEDK